MKPLFRYAILSDTHIRPPNLSSSPWKTNLKTNERAQHTAQAINTHHPDLVIHLGDIVHPVPHLPTHRAASNVAEEIMHTLQAPYYLVPGNHDIGDKTNPTVPAHTVNEDFIDYFKEHYGPTYQSFTHKNIHFIILNTPVLNSGLAEEKEQQTWLEKDLEENHGKRIHVFSHYPPYLHTPDEPDNYDNLDQPARAWLLELLEKHSVEAYYAGHIHQYFHKQVHNTDIVNLLATGNLRQDYATMFRTSPAKECGRDDPPKLGYCIVDIYQDTYVTHIKRSYGETTKPPIEKTIDSYYPSPSTHMPLGVELRYPLAETTTMPYMGPLDEYIRKTARNDYTYLALWETGIRTLRVPLSDLAIPETRKRLMELHEQGFRYIFFTLETPSAEHINADKHLIEALEIITPWKKAESTMEEASRLRKTTGVPTYISKIESSIDRPQTGAKFSHTMTTGFQAADANQIPAGVNIDGYSFQVTEKQPVLETINEIREASHGFTPLITVKLAPDDPASYPIDDNHHANRAAEALIAAYAYPDTRILLDTFTDHDRGYYPRHGLYDKLLNPRKPAKVLRNLDAALTTHGSEISCIQKEDDEWTTITFTSRMTHYTLNLPHINMPKEKQDTMINLVTGEINQKPPMTTQHLTMKPRK